jgi:peroxiredoxin
VVRGAPTRLRLLRQPELEPLRLWRSTFLVDEQSRVERAWYNVKADGHAKKVLAELRS